MKLVIVTAVAFFHDDMLRIFKKAGVKALSESDIDGYKTASAVLTASNWFASDKGGVKSVMLFAFTEDEKIDVLFELITEYNKTLETKNPVKAIVVPVERFI